jgi:tetratricopeptide (TPR) repeat protein
VRGTLGVPADDTPWLVTEAMTTASVDAWRHYQTALDLYRDGQRKAAIEELQRALEADPEFALALADLGLLYANAGDLATAHKYLERARQQGHRLPPAQRDHVLAEILASTWEGAAAAADILERQIAQNRDTPAVRNNLAAIYGGWEDYDRAAVLYDSLMVADIEYSGPWEAAVSVAVARGDFLGAHRILDGLPAGVADDWRLRWKRGWVWLEEGELDRARPILVTLVEEDEAAFMSRYELWRLAATKESWREALAWAEAIIQHAVRDGRTYAYEAWWGEVALARTYLFLGDADEALAAFARASTLAQDPARAAVSHCLAAEVALALGDPEQARDLARRALDRGEEQWPWLQGTALLGLAEQRLGKPEAADAALDRLVRRALNESNRPELRLSERLAGQLAFARGDYSRAVASLRRAAARLPPRGIEFHEHHLPDHAAVWFELGLAEARAANLEEARARLIQVLDSGVQKVQAPIAWVRSLYYLGELESARGNDAEAHAFYRRFLDLRRGSALDADLVERALRS